MGRLGGPGSRQPRQRAHSTTDSNHDVAILGYSQGVAVVSGELRGLGSLSPQQKTRLSVVLIGNIDNPDGGLFTRWDS